MNEADAAHWKILCAGSLQLRKQQIMGAPQKTMRILSAIIYH